MLLATLGADVIKVEPPKGDIARAIPPPQKGLAVVWMHSNLGKRSICLDLYREDHRKAMLKLVEGADILVENMRPGTVDRLGIGYDVASRVNPRIIFCSASGYGWSGPWRDVGAADAGMQCFSGWTSVTGAKGGRGELLRYVAHADITTSSYIAASVLLALYARERTGRGQRIETSMFAACLQLEATRVAEYFASGEVPRPMGTIVPTTAPHEAFAASDGDLVCVGDNHPVAVAASLRCAGPGASSRRPEIRQQCGASRAPGGVGGGARPRVLGPSQRRHRRVAPAAPQRPVQLGLDQGAGRSGPARTPGRAHPECRYARGSA